MLSNLGFVLEPMRTADFDELLDLWRSTERICLTDDDCLEKIAVLLDACPGPSFVCRYQGRIIGALLGNYQDGVGYLHHMAVMPEFRRRGIATALVGQSLLVMKRLQLRKCKILIAEENNAGLAFWEAMGWRLLERARTDTMESKAA